MLRRTAWVLGLTIMVSSFSLIASGLYGVYAYTRSPSPWEWHAWTVMLGMGALYIGIGAALYAVGDANIRKPWEALLATVLIWILIPLVDAFPFMLAARIPYIDAAFESVSGWTTTGLTILSGEPSSWRSVYVPLVDNIPETLKMWRSLMQWEGGLGIVILTVAVLAPPGVSAAVLYLAEGKFEKLEASFKRTSVIMGIIYVVLTAVSWLLFIVAGMPPLDAAHHAMTGIATAGFSPHSESLGYYYRMGNSAVLVAGMIVMMLGAINFSDHYNVLRGNLAALRQSIELQAQLLIIILAGLFSYLAWAFNPDFRSHFTLLQVVFHYVSAFATAGFQAGDLHATPDSYKLLLTILSLIGGSAFSTAGGIKVLRVLIAAKSISLEADTVIRPSGYVPRKRLSKYVVDETIVRRTLATISAFTGAYIVLVMIMSLVDPQYSLGDIMLEIASAMGNVGLSTGISAASAPVSAKIILIAAMLLGRLEVISYLIALKSLLVPR